ncbi:MAG: restriction endonuclease subunit S [Lachnospiraceae bacterium]|nr:restriction endonuclease subunit S [Lachnospiraceae bacterium]
MAEPKVRFKKDDGNSYPAWEDSFVGDICKIQTGKSNTQDAVEDGEYLFYVRSPIIYRSNRYLFDKEAVITVGDGVGTGKVFHYTNGKFDLHQRAYAMTDFRNMLGKYFYYYFSSHFYRRIVSLSAKTSVDSVRYEAIDKMKIEYPTSFEEQQKITDFLSSVDSVIATSEQEVANLETQKKAVMKKIFSQEVRFKRADGSDFPEWDDDELGSLCEPHARIGWQNLRTDEFLDEGDYYLVTGTDFVDGRVNFSTCHYIDKDRYEMDKNIQIQNEDILITKDGTLGKVAIVKGMDKPGTLNAGVFVLQNITNMLDHEYLYQYLAAPFLLKFAREKSTGGTIQHLNQGVLVQFSVPIPCLEEQRLIADFLSDFDEAIAAAKKELELWKELKKGLLQQMFV